MANTPFANLYKWDVKSQKITTATEMALNADKIDTKLKENSDNISLKANKAQENWIIATLQNGWTTTGNGVRYAKNDMNLISLQFEAVAGTVSAETVIAQLPQGYSPKNTVFRIISRTTGTVVGDIKIDENGYIKVPTGSTLSTGTICNGTVVFYPVA